MKVDKLLLYTHAYTQSEEREWKGIEEVLDKIMDKII
jgi:hypothetical protein